MRFRSMKTYFLSCLIFLFTQTSHANDLLLTESVETLTNQVEQACPKVWEDLGVKIDEGITAGDASIWGIGEEAETDRTEYSQFLAQLTQADSTNTDNQVAFDDVDRIRTHCTSARTALLSLFYSNLPQDVVASMPELTYEPGPPIDGFIIGDIRHTARPTPADGWIFLTGQTVGNEGSGADLQGNEYRELFDLFLPIVEEQISAQASCTEEDNADGTATTTCGSILMPTWDNNGFIPLPDMRGRTAVAADNMGGSSKGVMTDSNSGVIGGIYGTEKIALTTEQLPRHKHTINNGGVHKHTVYNDTHSHSIQVVTYDADTGATRYLSSQTDHGGPNVGVTSSVSPDTHKHTMGNSSSHNHTLGYSGSGESVTITQPSVTFNVEMKYK